MKVLVFPRDPNPYQGLLYGEMQRLGVQVVYVGDLTASHTLNLLLLPLETAAQRIAGAELIHLHWVFGFTFPGARRFPLLRRMAQTWFAAWLGACRMIGLRLVWTAHNVLPHEPVFADDRAARRTMVGACDLVLAHSPSALAELAALGAVARRSAVIPHGPISYGSAAATPSPALASRYTDGPRRFLFFGQVQEYKGVEELLTAFLGLPSDVDAELLVAGQCRDQALRSRLLALAERGGGRIGLRLEYVPDDEVAPLLGRADVVVLPFRRVTTSGSAMAALCHGRPLLVPDLATLADLPRDAVARYSGGEQALTAALDHLARADRETLAAMSEAAGRYAATVTWPDIAQQTMTAMVSVLDGTSNPDHGHLTEAR
ncbi:MAG TPA: glycosyltransferase [Streptosporangiaceae bacterium]|nr:glycosyltransferase [Streptosporangiaceae bacterium]